MSNGTETDPVRAVFRQIKSSLDLDRGPLTDIQKSAIGRAVVATVDGVPEVLFGVEPTDGSVLYAIHWVAGSTFGTLTVQRPDPGHSGPPEIDGWVRPLSEIKRVDLKVDVRQDRFVASEFEVRLHATVRWRDGETPVEIDGISLGDQAARDQATGMIRAVLNYVGVGVDE